MILPECIKKKAGKQREALVARLEEQIAQMDHEAILERLEMGMWNVERKMLLARLVEGTRD